MLVTYRRLRAPARYRAFEPIFNFFSGGNINIRILSPEKKLKIGQNNPKNQRTLSYARGLMKAWQQFLSSLEQELGPENVKAWVPKLGYFDAGNIYLEPVDSFQISWFEEHIRPRLKTLLNNNGRPIQVHLIKETKKGK